MSGEINSEFVNEIEILMDKVTGKIELYLKSIKELSVNEIMHGSIPKAQEILVSVMPIQNAKENLINAQLELLNLLKAEKAKTIESPKEQFRKTHYIKDEPTKIINQNILRAGILKSLIYLGGNADLKDISEFVKQEILKGNDSDDSAKLVTENDGQLKKIVSDESYRMLKEGFIIEDNLSKKWEILPAGIDFLSKYDLLAKSKVN
ncbi:MAG: hypothetical protein Fur0015_05890 [Ignavibacteriales bacterium]